MIRQPHWYGVVAWANPRWFEEAGQPRQGWSRPYMIDANMVASLRGAPVEYQDDHMLQGLRIGSVQGYHYKEALLGTCKLVKPGLAAATNAQRKLCR